ncbi:MAG: nuclear transport factor 2 family protein [Deltaproteobacteria bacterium]|nr:MAG: nuclear transport factor 2 family protein [Deltaproteobacteria bacterium]
MDREALARLMQRVDELDAREQIRDLARRYADCVWRKDVEGAAALFADDGVMDTGDRPPIRGRVRIREEYERAFRDSDFQPFVHNHVIDSLAGDEATGRCYLDLRATIEGRSMIGAGHYEDRYCRVEGTWYFSSRKLVMDFLVPLDEGWAR